MKKVVMIAGPVHENPPLKGAAVESWMFEVCQRLISYETHIISIGHPFYATKEYRNGIFFHRINISDIYKRIFQKILGWDVFSYNKRIIELLKDICPDIVHIHNYSNGREIIEWLKSEQPHVKIVFHFHNEAEEKKFVNFPACNLTLSCSQYINTLNEARISAPAHETLYNGVDIEKFTNAKSQRSMVRQSFGIEEDKLNVFYYGRISPEKGVDKIVEIAKELKNHKNIRFYCVGEISAKNDRHVFYHELLEQIRIHELNSIKFLDVIVPSKMPLAYQLADVAIVPSQFEEPFCMVAIEAMSAGIPLIAAKKGGMVEYLKNDENAFVVDDYEKFSTEAAQLLKHFNQQKNANIIESAANMVQQRFSWEIIANQLEDYYNALDPAPAPAHK